LARPVLGQDGTLLYVHSAPEQLSGDVESLLDQYDGQSARWMRGATQATPPRRSEETGRKLVAAHKHLQIEQQCLGQPELLVATRQSAATAACASTHLTHCGAHLEIIGHRRSTNDPSQLNPGGGEFHRSNFPLRRVTMMKQVADRFEPVRPEGTSRIRSSRRSSGARRANRSA